MHFYYIDLENNGEYLCWSGYANDKEEAKKMMYILLEKNNISKDDISIIRFREPKSNVLWK